MTHTCTKCHRPIEAHETDSGHWPAPCCPGCESYEAANDTAKTDPLYSQKRTDSAADHFGYAGIGQ